MFILIISIGRLIGTHFIGFEKELLDIEVIKVSFTPLIWSAGEVKE